MPDLFPIRIPKPPWVHRVRHFLGPRAHKLHFLLDCAQQYGDVVDLSLGMPTYMLNSPDDIKYILETHHQNYAKTRNLTGKSGKHLAGKGILTSSGMEALHQRRRLNPLFARASLGPFAEVITHCTEQMMTRWHGRATLDIAEEMLGLTHRIIGKVVLGVDFAGEARALGEAFHTWRRYFEISLRRPFPLPETILTRVHPSYRGASQYIHHTLTELIRTRRRIPETPSDFLSLLLSAQNRAGTTMSEELVRDEAMTSASTGYVTIGLALTWTWYLLAQHPEIAARLMSEVDVVLHGRIPNADDLPQLRYTEMVLQEALRLYPPTWLFVRIPQQDDVLPSGFRVTAGAKLYLCPYVTHRLPRYFPDPERFDPERFTEAAKQTRPRHAYYPFSAGPRVCLGQGFALMEGVLVLATIAQRFTLELVPGHPVVPEPRLILVPRNGIWVRTKYREAQIALSSLR